MLRILPTTSNESLILVEGSGSISARDLRDLVRAVASCDPKGGILYDFRRADLGSVGSEDLEGIADLVVKSLPNQAACRAAFVGSASVHAGLFRMFLAYAECARIRRRYEYFTDYGSALEWVRVPAEAGFGGNPTELTKGRTAPRALTT